MLKKFFFLIFLLSKAFGISLVKNNFNSIKNKIKLSERLSILNNFCAHHKKKLGAFSVPVVWTVGHNCFLAYIISKNTVDKEKVFIRLHPEKDEIIKMQYSLGKISPLDLSFYESLKLLFSAMPSALKSMLFLKNYHRIYYKKSSFSYYPILFTFLRVKDRFKDSDTNEDTPEYTWEIKKDNFCIYNSIKGEWGDIEVISKKNDTILYKFPKYRFFYHNNYLNYIKTTYTKK
jgi:hypothetical protein